MKFKAIVINMKNNPERLAFMTKQLADNNIDFVIQVGVDGSTYDFSQEYDDEDYKKHNGGSSLSKGERGCALSHKRSIEGMLNDNCDHALIMEDDVELPDNFKKIIEQELNNRSLGKTRWDYLSFNYPSVGVKAIILWLFLFTTMWGRQRGVMKYVKLPMYFIKFTLISSMSLCEKVRDSLYKKIYTYGAPALFFRPLYLAGCYLVTKEGAKKLLEMQGNKILYSADRLPNMARVKKGLKFYAFVPHSVIQRRDRFQSNSVEKEFDEKVKKFMGGRLLRE
jgi:GR25 family glycosyltransferase involved in LPS biosynthesis